jgi:hypothetical protein
MAVLETGLYTYLAASTPITALVSDRIFPNAIPPGEAFPCVTFNRIGGEQPHHMTAAAVIQSARIQVDCWGKDPDGDGYEDAATIAEAIRNRLDGYRGSMGSVTVRTCHLDSQRDDYEAPTDGSGVGIDRVSQEYLVWYSIAAPSLS